MSNFQWQLYPSFGFSYSRKPYGGGYNFYDNYLIIGPLQMRWWL